MLGVMNRIGMASNGLKSEPPDTFSSDLDDLDLKGRSDDNIYNVLKQKLHKQNEKKTIQTNTLKAKSNGRSNDDVYNVLKRKGIKFEEDEDNSPVDNQGVTLNCMKCEFFTTDAKHLMKHIHTVHRKGSQLPNTPRSFELEKKKS